MDAWFTYFVLPIVLILAPIFIVGLVGTLGALVEAFSDDN